MNASIAATTNRFQARGSATLALFTLLTLAVMSSQGAVPMLVSRLGLRSDVAQSIARAVETLGHVPWWALVIIGGGVADVLVRLIIGHGWRYAASW